MHLAFLTVDSWRTHVFWLCYYYTQVTTGKLLLNICIMWNIFKLTYGVCFFQRMKSLPTRLVKMWSGCCLTRARRRSGASCRSTRTSVCVSPTPGTTLCQPALTMSKSKVWLDSDQETVFHLLFGGMWMVAWIEGQMNRHTARLTDRLNDWLAGRQVDRQASRHTSQKQFMVLMNLELLWLKLNTDFWLE